MFENERKFKLSPSEFLSLCARFEEKFPIDARSKNGDTIIYQLKGSINRMRWIRSGNITMQQDGEDIVVKCSIQGDIILPIISIIFFIYLALNGGLILGLMALVFLNLFALFLRFIGHEAFRMRINKSINELLAERNMISEEQSKWIDDQDRCPACGYKGVTNENVCPECGLHLKALP